jgi:hypothetical protein
MAKPKNPPPTAEQEHRVELCWSILLYSKARIAEETGLTPQQVVGLIASNRGQHWTRERVRRLHLRDAEIGEQAAECTRREMDAALAVAGAHKLAAIRGERAIAAAPTDVEALKLARHLPTFESAHRVERVNTGRPVAGPPAPPTVGDDRSKSILERAIERCREEGLPGIPTEPFPGEEGERPKADPTKGDL